MQRLYRAQVLHRRQRCQLDWTLAYTAKRFMGDISAALGNGTVFKVNIDGSGFAR